MTTRQNINIETLEGFRTFLKDNPEKGQLHLEAKAIYEGQAGRSMIHVGEYTFLNREALGTSIHCLSLFGGA